MSSRFGCHRRVPISTPLPSGSSARSKRSVSVAWSRLARLMCASSSTSSSNIAITRETIRAATTNSCSDRHRRSTRTPTWSGGSASADFSASTTERPHEGAADYLHLTGWSPVSWGSIDEPFVNLTMPSARMRSPPRSAWAGWGRSTARRIRSWIVRSRSRSYRSHSLAIPTGLPASSVKPRRSRP